MLARPWIVGSVLIFGLTTPTVGQQADGRLGPADGRDLRPTEIDRVAIGHKAPDFTLPQHGGGTVTLSDLRDSTNVVLLFYRGSWCRYCMGQLRELRQLLDDDFRSQTTIVVVSTDGERETQQTLARIGHEPETKPDFTFLSDGDHTVIDRYGFLNPSGKSSRDPHPATFVIDRDGIVRWRFVATDYTVRPSNEDIRAALLALDGNEQT